MKIGDIVWVNDYGGSGDIMGFYAFAVRGTLHDDESLHAVLLSHPDELRGPYTDYTIGAACLLDRTDRSRIVPEDKVPPEIWATLARLKLKGEA